MTTSQTTPPETTATEPDESKREFSQAKRDKMAKGPKAMNDGSYPIENITDLKNAISAYGRADEEKRPELRKHIVRNAKKLHAENMLPKNWSETPEKEKKEVDPFTAGVLLALAGMDDDDPLGVELKAGPPGATFPSKDPGATKLRQYWTKGPGAAKIAWGTPGDFNRCVTNLSKHVGERAKGLCNIYHRSAIGAPPGKGHKSLIGESLRAPGIDAVRDRLQMKGLDTGANLAEVVYVVTRRDGSDPRFVCGTVGENSPLVHQWTTGRRGNKSVAFSVSGSDEDSAAIFVYDGKGEKPLSNWTATETKRLEGAAATPLVVVAAAQAACESGLRAALEGTGTHVATVDPSLPFINSRIESKNLWVPDTDAPGGWRAHESAWALETKEADVVEREPDTRSDSDVVSGLDKYEGMADSVEQAYEEAIANDIPWDLEPNGELSDPETGADGEPDVSASLFGDTEE